MPINSPRTLFCTVCGQAYQSTGSRAMYCSQTCRRAADAARNCLIDEALVRLAGRPQTAEQLLWELWSVQQPYDRRHIQRRLLALTEQGKLTRSKRGKAYVYRRATDLPLNAPKQ